LSDLLKVLAPNYGPDVRMSNGILLGSNQNEFQIDVNPTNSLNAIGTSNDGGVAGVGIFVSQNGGMTWTSADASTYGVPSACGDPISAPGYQQSSQPRVASNGWIYVGYQEYNDQNIGCSAGVRNEVARSTDGGATWTITELTIVQGGACTSAQAGRGIFCINGAGSSFRSRSHPIMGVNPSDPTHVYMVYSGGDLEPTGTYSCG